MFVSSRVCLGRLELKKKLVHPHPDLILRNETKSSTTTRYMEAASHWLEALKIIIATNTSSTLPAEIRHVAITKYCEGNHLINLYLISKREKKECLNLPYRPVDLQPGRRGVLGNFIDPMQSVQ